MEETQKKSLAFPDWARDIFYNYYTKNFHQFLIDGNIRDLELNPDKSKRHDNPLIPVLEILIETLRLTGVRHIVYFSSSSGLVFISDENGFRLSSRLAGAQEDIELAREFETKVRKEDRRKSLLPAQIRDHLNLIEKTLKTTWIQKDGKELIGVATIIDNVEKIIPDNMDSDADVRLNREMIREWGLSRDILMKEKRPISILLTDNRNFLPPDIHSRESGTCIITIPLPDFIARKTYFELLKKQPHNNSPLHKYLEEDQNAPIELSQLTRGFRFFDCQMITRISTNEDEKVRDYFLNGENCKEQITDYLLTQKSDVIKDASRGILEPVSATLSFADIGGLCGAQEYFRTVAKAILSENKQMRKIIPKGVLLVGPPGTGKSILAKALAEETGVSLVRMGNIRSMWVGESERNLSMVLNLLKAMAPVIVFVDEIDQAMGGRSANSGDSGVSGRIFQQILEFMGDNENRGQVIWIAATNRADLLDDALISRFDRIIPVLLPGSKEEWTGVMKGIFHQLNIETEDSLLTGFLDDEKYYQKLSQHSGRSMETVIRLAYQNMLYETQGSNEVLTLEFLKEAFDHFKTNINHNMYLLQTLLAVAACNDTNFITKPGEHGYSYGDRLNQIIQDAITKRNNDSLEEEINKLRRGMLV